MQSKGYLCFHFATKYTVANIWSPLWELTYATLLSLYTDTRNRNYTLYRLNHVKASMLSLRVVLSSVLQEKLL